MKTHPKSYEQVFGSIVLKISKYWQEGNRGGGASFIDDARSKSVI